MGAFSRARFEAFARGVAAGLSIRAAGTAAGYSPASNACYLMARKEAFRAEVRRLEVERRYAGSSDLAPIVAILVEAAISALAKGDAALVTAAARMLAEAARLKQKLPAARVEGGMTDDEWADRYGAKS